MPAGDGISGGQGLSYLNRTKDEMRSPACIDIPSPSHAQRLGTRGNPLPWIQTIVTGVPRSVMVTTDVSNAHLGLL